LFTQFQEAKILHVERKHIEILNLNALQELAQSCAGNVVRDTDSSSSIKTKA